VLEGAVQREELGRSINRVIDATQTEIRYKMSFYAELLMYAAILLLATVGATAIFMYGAIRAFRDR
jgi:hypothetical protein